MDPQRPPAIEPTKEDAESYLQNSGLLLSHLVLRPFIDSYAVVAHELLQVGSTTIDEKQFIDRCLQIGKQWVLQGKIASAESISGEMFATALRLARHRKLLDPTDGVDGHDLESAAENSCVRPSQFGRASPPSALGRPAASPSTRPCAPSSLSLWPKAYPPLSAHKGDQ